MSTRQKINLPKSEGNILDLNGNYFQVKPYYRLYLNFPFKTGEQYFTRDLISGRIFNLIYTSKGNWYAVLYISEIGMYLLRKLKWLKYIPEIDIKTSHLYGKRRSKVSKTYGYNLIGYTVSKRQKRS